MIVLEIALNEKSGFSLQKSLQEKYRLAESVFSSHLKGMSSDMFSYVAFLFET